MGIDPLQLQYLPEPPKDRPAVFKIVDGKAEMELKIVVRQGVWKALWGYGALAVVSSLVLAVVLAWVFPGAMLYGMGLSLAACSAVTVVITAVVLSAASMIKSRLVYDGQTLFIDEMTSRRAFARERVRGVCVVVHVERSVQLNTSDPNRPTVYQGPTVSLEIEVPEGRLRVLRGREETEVAWAAETLAQLLDVPQNPRRSAKASPEPKASMSKSAGKSRRLMMFGALAFGVVFIGIIAYSLVPGLKSYRWPTTTGVVTQSNFEDRGNGHYDADVEFAYRVNGVDYTSDNVACFRDKPDLYRWLSATHTKGASIDVYYDPSKPERATLIRGVGGLGWCFRGMGVLFVLTSAGMWLTRPTPEQERLLCAYQTDVAAVQGAMARVRDAVSWEVPKNILDLELAKARRELLIQAVRISLLIAIIVAPICYFFGPVLEPIVKYGIVGMAAMFPVLLVLQWLVTLKGISRPVIYSLDDEGIHTPSKKQPLVNWEVLECYLVEPHPLDPGVRQLRVFSKDFTKVRTAIPSDAAGDRVLEVIAAHLPEAAPDRPIGPPVSERLLSAGIAIVFIYAVIVGWIAMNHSTDIKSYLKGGGSLRGYQSFAALFLLGPGWLWLAVYGLSRLRRIDVATAAVESSRKRPKRGPEWIMMVLAMNLFGNGLMIGVSLLFEVGRTLRP